jgi:hypothetical protein
MSSSRLERVDTGRKIAMPDGTMVDEVYELSKTWPGVVSKGANDALEQLVAWIEYVPEHQESAPVADDDGNEIGMESSTVPAHYVIWRAPSILLAVLYAPVLGGQEAPQQMQELIETFRYPYTMKNEQGETEEYPPERAYRRRLWCTPTTVRSDDESFDLREAMEEIAERLAETAEDEEAPEAPEAPQPQNGAPAQTQ